DLPRYRPDMDRSCHDRRVRSLPLPVVPCYHDAGLQPRALPVTPERQGIMQQHKDGPFRRLATALRNGEIDRRQFIQGATALGMSVGMASFIATHAGAQEASPEVTGVAGADARPQAGTENQERGAGGELRIIQWQAPSHLSSHQATGDKDSMA